MVGRASRGGRTDVRVGYEEGLGMLPTEIIEAVGDLTAGQDMHSSEGKQWSGYDI